MKKKEGEKMKKKLAFTVLSLCFILSSSAYAWVDAINPFPGGLNLGHIATPGDSVSYSANQLLIGRANTNVYVTVRRLPLRKGLNFLDTNYNITVYGAGQDSMGRIIPHNGKIYMNFSVTATSDFGDMAGEYTTVLPTVKITIRRGSQRDTAGFKIKCIVGSYIEAGPDRSFNLGSINKPGDTATFERYLLKIGKANVKVNVHIKTEALKREERDGNGHGIGSFDVLNTITRIWKGINRIEFHGDDERDIGSVHPLPGGGLFLTRLKINATSHPISWGSKGLSDDAGEYAGKIILTLSAL